MTDVYVGAVADFEESDRVIVTIDRREVGVMKVNGNLFAFVNRCPHQGGPVCEGLVIGQVKTLLTAEQRDAGRTFDESSPNLVCPWHGWEFDLSTGECIADRRLKLRPVPIKVDDDSVYLVV